jgi:hypothetical protein
VLALSVSWMGDRRPKDSGGANHHYKMCKEIVSKETSKQIFLYSTSKWRLLKWLVKVWKGEEGKWKVVSPFSFFQISFIYFWFFIKCKGEQKQICSGKGEKKMVDLGVREKTKMEIVEEGWKRKWDNYQFTSRWELHVYSLRARLYPYLWRLIRRCNWRSCRNRHGFFVGVSPNEFPCWLPQDVR